MPGNSPPHPWPTEPESHPADEGAGDQGLEELQAGQLEREKTWARPGEVTLERQLHLNLTLHPGRVFTGSQGLETGLNIPAAFFCI